MKAWFDQLPTEARWVIGAAGASVAIAVLALLAEVTGILIDSAQDIGRHKPRIARMLGYEATAQELQAAAREFERALDGLAYPGSEDANAAGARLQQTLRGFAEDAGLTVVGSQLAVVTPEGADNGDEDEDEESFDQLAVDLSLDGPPIALDAFLVAISQHTPALATVSVDIQRKRWSRRDGDAKFEFLTVRLRVVALRVAI